MLAPSASLRPSMGERSSLLQGLQVVSTRPVGQARGLAAKLISSGARVLPFPTIEIVPVADANALGGAEAQARDADVVLFVSVNAVDTFLARAGASRSLTHASVGAVGGATAARLGCLGVRVALVPCPADASANAYSSEALLKHPALAAGALTGKRVLIVRGDGGRALLGDTLAARGARVRYAQVYRRACATPTVAQCREVLACPEPMVVVVTSDEGLRNFWKLLAGELLPSTPSGARDNRNGRRWLEERRYVVVSDRIAKTVLELGARAPAVVAALASDGAIHDAIARYAASLSGVPGVEETPLRYP